MSKLLRKPSNVTRNRVRLNSGAQFGSEPGQSDPSDVRLEIREDGLKSMHNEEQIEEDNDQNKELKLPSQEIKQIHNQVEAEKEQCSICYEAFGAGPEEIMTKCGHRFYRVCLETLGEGGSCPLCREELVFPLEIGQLFYGIEVENEEELNQLGEYRKTIDKKQEDFKILTREIIFDPFRRVIIE